jgi:osmotically-inducible protein OsmY
MEWAGNQRTADVDLKQRIVSFLAARHVPGLRNLHVRVERGVVTITGCVLTFYEKQLCNECCRRVAGVRQVVNDVSVVGTLPGAAVVA